MKDFYAVTGYLSDAEEKKGKKQNGKWPETIEDLSRRALADGKSALKLMNIALNVADEMVRISDDSD